MRIAIVPALLLAVAGIAGETQPPVPNSPPAPAIAPPQLPATQAATIDALLERAIAAGLPDLRGATLTQGKIEITSPQESNDNMIGGLSLQHGRAVTHHKDGKRIVTMEGIHARLADGRWLAGLRQLVVPADNVEVRLADGARELPPGGLSAAMRRDQPRPGDQEDEERFYKLFAGEEQARLRAGADTLKNLREDMIWGDLIALHLRRLGLAEADSLLLFAAAVAQMPWMNTESADVLELGAGHRGFRMRGFDGNPDAWMTENAGKLSLPDPSVTAGRMLAEHFAGLLTDAKALAAHRLEPAAAAAAAIALLPEAERAARAPAIDRLIARLALPEKAPEGADLAARVQLWNPSSREMHFISRNAEDEEAVDYIPAEALAQMPAEARAHYERMRAERTQWKPRAEDAAGLIALLADRRPSRWLDGAHARTLGDNALRALATVVGFDPRLLISRDTGAAWTDAERDAVATGLQAWFTALGGKPIAEGLTAAIDRLPAEAVATILQGRPADQRAPLLDRIAALWKAGPPRDAEPQHIGAIIAQAGDHAGIAAALAAWPVADGFRPLLACWHDRAGRPAELDKLIDEIAADRERHDILSTALAQAMQRPSAARLQRCLGLLAGPHDDPRTWAPLAAALDNGSDWDEAWMGVSAMDGDQGRVFSSEDADKADPAKSIKLAVVALALADRRPIEDKLLEIESYPEWSSVQITGMHVWMHARGQRGRNQEPAKGPENRPSELRMRDLAAAALGNNALGLGLQELTRDDLWRPAAERDAAMRQAVEAVATAARAALTAAKLPDVVPADLAAPAAGGDALF
jgi:hypothetical protein